QVENADKSEGDFHLVTVRGGQATPIQFLLAKILPHHQIMDIKDVRPEGISDDEYFEAQLHMMESSQEASTVVAYEAAEKDITIEYNGVYVVSVAPGLPADNILRTGDRIIGIDNQQIKESNDLISYVESKENGDKVMLTILRDDKEIKKKLYSELLMRKRSRSVLE
uniref:PDZ domain-containing protein n=1 Tax=Ornithinibacillus scapharcae TaxID=1147159 RepID=UPI0030795426